MLVYDPFPTTNGASANIVLGQPDFTYGESNAGSLTASAQSLSGPFGLPIFGNRLFVSDDNNSRVLVFDLP